jgi:hypothetical protein
MAGKAVGGYDFGNANFGASAGARNVTAAMNPLTPGGMSPRNTHLPTLGWAVLFVVALFLVYHFVLKGR